MATTISSATNPYKLGSPPDFGTLYSGRALDFDGVSDYVEIADSDDLSFGDGTNDSPFSMSAWINVEDVSDGFYIINKGIPGSGTHEYLFYLPSGKLTF